MALADVSLAGGMVVSCLQKHEVPILDLEVQGYFKHLELRPGERPTRSSPRLSPPVSSPGTSTGAIFRPESAWRSQS